MPLTDLVQCRNLEGDAQYTLAVQQSIARVFVLIHAEGFRYAVHQPESRFPVESHDP